MNRPFPGDLRSEYDAKVLDITQRRRHAARLQKALFNAGLWRRGAKLLDVGCGSGLLLDALGTDVGLRVGCDVRSELYDQAKPHLRSMFFVRAEGGHLPFPDCYFDLVTCLAAIEEFPDWTNALQEMTRCIAPNGVLCVTVTNGRLLLPFYSLLEKFGLKVKRSSWEYARVANRYHSIPVAGGFGVQTLAQWSFLDLTPQLALGHWGWLRIPTPKGVSLIAERFAPSFAYAWRRPGERL